TWASRHSTWVPARATRCWICCMPSRKPAATNFPTSSPTAAPAMSPAATPTPPSPPKNSAGTPNSASKPCAPTPGAGSPTTPKATAKPPPGSTPSHPGRVLLRFGGGVGYVVGAPPRGGRVRPNPRPMQPPFAPGAGAPTVRGWVWFCCRSTAHGANGVGTHSHPGRVLLRVGGGIGFFVGAPPRCERGRAQTLLTHTSPCT